MHITRSTSTPVTVASVCEGGKPSVVAASQPRITSAKPVITKRKGSKRRKKRSKRSRKRSQF